MDTGKIAALVLIASLLGLALGARAVAGEESGSFSTSGDYVRDYTTIEHADGKVTAGAVIGTTRTIRSSGGPFEEGRTGYSTCLVHAKVSQEDIDIESNCTTTDTDGDNWFVRGKRTGGTLREGGGGEGHYDLIGGTGKYAGVSGQCTYTTRYLPGVHAVSDMQCNWTRP